MHFHVTTFHIDWLKFAKPNNWRRALVYALSTFCQDVSEKLPCTASQTQGGRALV